MSLLDFMTAPLQQAETLTVADITRLLTDLQRVMPRIAPSNTLFISRETKKKLWWYMHGEEIIRADLMRRTAGMRRRQARAHTGKRHRHG